MTEKNRAWREEYHFANCVIRSDTRELLRDGVAQKIERRSFDLILYLLQLEGRVASKDELLEHVWGNHFVSESVIAQSIMKVRKALGITGKEPGPIKTIHRVGYRFASEVRKAIHSPASHAVSRRQPGPSRILWLPTEGTLDRPDLSWVRYGLISVATHVLHGHGVPTVPASEAIRLHEAVMDGRDDGDATPSGVRETGLPVVHSHIKTCGDRYRLQWRMQLEGTEHGNQIEGAAPADLALRAAQEVALIVRLQAGPHPTAGQEARFLADAAQLVALAVALDQIDRTFSLLATCTEMAQCPLPIWAEFVLLLAQRGDESTPTCTEQLIERARLSQDCAHEGWALLCSALHLLYRHCGAEAVELVMGGVTLVRQAVPHALYARSLLLASHVLATTGRVGEAAVLWHEAASIASRHPTQDMACRVHLLRCELDFMEAGSSIATRARCQAQEASRWLGLSPLTASIHALHSLQSCARGDFDRCREELDHAQRAADNGGAAPVRLFVRLQLGNFLARCGDRAGLQACIGELDDPALRTAPLGHAVARWLRARQCHLSGDTAQALPLAEAAMEELADLGIWCGEDQWIFVAQLALAAGNRRSARHLLQRLQARHEHHPLRSRQVTVLAVEGMLEYAEGNAGKALPLLEHACRLARGTLVSNILLFGLTWLALIDGRNPSPAQLMPAGQWVEGTREGRYVRSTLHNKPYWAISRREHPVLLGTATELLPHRVTDVDIAGPSSYAQHLPMPV